MAGFVVGLTGGIGSGKTTVSNLFARLGIEIADADVVARTIVEPGKSAHEAIRERFGESILLHDGSLNRAKLREIVFSNNSDRKWLENLTHGPIVQQLREIIASATSPYSVLVLSAGTGRSPMINKMLVIDVPEALQISRVTARDNNSIEQIKAIIKTQPSRQERLGWADDIITNDGSLENLRPEVEHLNHKYLILAADHG